MAEYEVQTTKDGSDYRITHIPTDSRVATCYMKENADFVCRALNAMGGAPWATRELARMPEANCPTYVTSGVRCGRKAGHEGRHAGKGDGRWHYQPAGYENAPTRAQVAREMPDPRTCEHGRGMSNYCHPCGRIHGG